MKRAIPKKQLGKTVDLKPLKDFALKLSPDSMLRRILLEANGNMNAEDFVVTLPILLKLSRFEQESNR
jgi:hypothetical protein